MGHLEMCAEWINTQMNSSCVHGGQWSFFHSGPASHLPYTQGHLEHTSLCKDPQATWP